MTRFILTLLSSAILAWPLLAQDAISHFNQQRKRIVGQVEKYQESHIPNPYYLIDDQGHTYALPGLLDGQTLYEQGMKIAITGLVGDHRCTTGPCLTFSFLILTISHTGNTTIIIEYPVNDDGMAMQPTPSTTKVVGQVEKYESGNYEFLLIDSNDQSGAVLPFFLDGEGLYTRQTKISITSHSDEMRCIISHCPNNGFIIEYPLKRSSQRPRNRRKAPDPSTSGGVTVKK